MKILAAFLVSLAMSVPAHSEPAPAASADDGLRAWLDEQPLVRLKLQDVAMRAQVGFDLKDAVASSSEERRSADEIADAAQSARRERLERLPGMEPASFESCRTSGCSGASSAFHVGKDGLIPEAISALVSPWIRIQKERGQDVLLEAAADFGDRIMTVRLGGPRESSLAVYVAPVPAGGYEVWLRRT